MVAYQPQNNSIIKYRFNIPTHVVIQLKNVFPVGQHIEDADFRDTIKSYMTLATQYRHTNQTARTDHEKIITNYFDSLLTNYPGITQYDMSVALTNNDCEVLLKEKMT